MRGVEHVLMLQARRRSMAEIRIDGEQVSIHLSFAEKIGALHGDLHFPVSAVRAVRVVDKPFSEIEGVRSPGTGVPGVIALGTYRARGGRDFVAVYRGERGAVIEIDAGNTKYRRVILSAKDPESLRSTVESAR
jgi:hypothetical protein